MTESYDPFGARRTIYTPLGERVIYRLDALAVLGGETAFLHPLDAGHLAKDLFSAPLGFGHGNLRVWIIQCLDTRHYRG